MGCGIKHECIGNCCICIHTPNGNSEWLKQVKHDEQVRANAIDECISKIGTLERIAFGVVETDLIKSMLEQLKEQKNEGLHNSIR